MDADRQASEQLSLRGVALDPRDALVWSISAHVQGFVKHRLTVAMDMFEQALTINPCCAFAWARSATTANFLGRGEDAQQRVRNALRLSPFDKQAFTFVTTNATASFVLGRYDEAIQLYQEGAPRQPATTRPHGVCSSRRSLLSDGVEEARERGGRVHAVRHDFRVGDFSTWYPMQRTAHERGAAGNAAGRAS